MGEVCFVEDEVVGERGEYEVEDYSEHPLIIGNLVREV